MSKDAMRRGIHRLILIVSALIMIPYLLVMTGLWRQLDPEYREFVRLCKDKAHFTVYRTVEADGIVNNTGENVLVHNLARGNLKFFEFCQDEPRRQSELNPFPDSGCYRVEKVWREGSKCNTQLDRQLRLNSPLDDRFLAKHCLSVKKIEAVTARYVFESVASSRPVSNRGSSYIEGRTWIHDSVTGEVLSEYKNYSVMFGLVNKAQLACYRVTNQVPSFAAADIVGRTIHSDKDVNNDRGNL